MLFNNGGSATFQPIIANNINVTANTIPTTGLYRPSAGILAFGCNAALCGEFDASGNFILSKGHLWSASTNVTSSALSGCGTSPAINASATDTKGTITEGTTATGCVLTFLVAYTVAPDCVISSPTGNTPTSYSTSTTALTIVNISATGDKFTYHCIQ